MFASKIHLTFFSTCSSRSKHQQDCQGNFPQRLRHLLDFTEAVHYDFQRPGGQSNSLALELSSEGHSQFPRPSGSCRRAEQLSPVNWGGLAALPPPGTFQRTDQHYNPLELQPRGSQQLPLPRTAFRRTKQLPRATSSLPVTQKTQRLPRSWPAPAALPT